MTDFYICPSDTTETTLETGTMYDPYKANNIPAGAFAEGNELRLLPNWGASGFNELFEVGGSGSDLNKCKITTAPGESDKADIINVGKALNISTQNFITISDINIHGGDAVNGALQVQNSVYIDIQSCGIFPINNGRGLRTAGDITNFTLIKSVLDGNGVSAELLYHYVANTKTHNNITIGGSVGNKNIFRNSGGRGVDAIWYGDATFHSYNISHNYFTGGGGYCTRWHGDGSFGVDFDNKAYAFKAEYNEFVDTYAYAIHPADVTSVGGKSSINYNKLKDIGKTSGAGSCNGIGVRGCDGVEIIGNDIDGVYCSTDGDGNGIIIDYKDTYGSTDTLVKNNIVRNCQQGTGAGISNYRSQDTKVIGNISYNNKHGISVGEYTTAPNTSGCEFYHNTMFDNVENGVDIRSTGGVSTFKNNISYNNGGYDFSIEKDGSAPVSDNNCGQTYSISDASHEAWVESNGITEDPLVLTNGKINRFSPAVDTGLFISDINDNGICDAWGKYLHKLPNVGADQGAGAPSGRSSTLQLGGGLN